MTAHKDESPAQLIDARIEELDDRRGKTLEEVRRIIKEADPEIVEEWKWRQPRHPVTPSPALLVSRSPRHPVTPSPVPHPPSSIVELR